MEEKSRWLNVPDDLFEHFGVVYLIRNTHPDAERKYYIGCKQLMSKVRLKPTKTRKRSKIVYKDNGFEKYWGSSKELLKDMEKFGEENFTKEIIEVCDSKFHMKYAELDWQIKAKVLFDKRFFNGIVNVRLGRVPENYKEVERDVSALNL